MASASNEAPSGAEESGCKEGCPLPNQGRGLGRWLCPLPRFFSIFELKLASFGVFWELILLQ